MTKEYAAAGLNSILRSEGSTSAKIRFLEDETRGTHGEPCAVEAREWCDWTFSYIRDLYDAVHALPHQDASHFSDDVRYANYLTRGIWVVNALVSYYEGMDETKGREGFVVSTALHLLNAMETYAPKGNYSEVKWQLLCNAWWSIVQSVDRSQPDACDLNTLGIYLPQIIKFTAMYDQYENVDVWHVRIDDFLLGQTVMI